MPLFAASQTPISDPGPWTRLTWPGGNPASSRIWTSSAALRGVDWGGLTTTVFPDASAGAILWATMLSGELNEVIPQTRSEERRVGRECRPGRAANDIE